MKETRKNEGEKKLMLEKSHEAELSQKIKERSVMQEFHPRIAGYNYFIALQIRTNPPNRVEINAEWNWNALSSWEMKEWRNRNFNSLLKFSNYPEPPVQLAVVSGCPWQLAKEWWSLTSVRWALWAFIAGHWCYKDVLCWFVPWSWFVTAAVVEMNFWFIFLSLPFHRSISLLIPAFSGNFTSLYFKVTLLIPSHHCKSCHKSEVMDLYYWLCFQLLVFKLLIPFFVYLPDHVAVKEQFNFFFRSILIHAPNFHWFV